MNISAKLAYLLGGIVPDARDPMLAHVYVQAPAPPTGPACCSCGRLGEMKSVGEGRRPFCESCWGRHIAWLRGR